jgi:hypothetical protein
VLVLAVSAAVSGTAFGARSSGAVSIATWRMNEGPSASIAQDASGNNLDGSVGSEVQTGVAFASATGYHFPAVSGSPPTHPEHLVQVPDDSRLDPGSGNFEVTLRFRTSQTSGNIVQKGQSGMTGGYWKFESHEGVVTCLFRSGDGTQSTATSRTPLTDGAWHNVTCTRTPQSVTMFVDGDWRDQRNNPTGTISNSAPLVIGGKVFCNQVDVGCDYFSGDIDFVRIDKP